MRSALINASIFASLLLSSCTVTSNVQDPTVILHTSGGSELGVSTSQGVVFLGRTANSGEVDMTVWYGDGPSIEASIIEPIGDGLYLAQGEITMPIAGIAFPDLTPEDVVFARGRHGAEVWEVILYPANDPRVEGLAFRADEPLPQGADQAGAGIFWLNPLTDKNMLIGLVSGSVQFGETGPRYITAIGGKGLWRLVAHRIESNNQGGGIYRDDIL